MDGGSDVHTGAGTGQAGAMMIYARAPGRRTAQVIGDLLTVGWIVGWIWLASKVRDVTLALAVPGERVEQAGLDLAGNLGEVAGRVDNLPGLGDALAAPFEGAAGAGQALVRAAQAQQAAVEVLAWLLALMLAVPPILLALLLRVPFRVRWAREATAGQDMLDRGVGTDLLAVRALAKQPLAQLARISRDPAGDWRRGDPDVVTALATLEADRLGILPPPVIERALDPPH